VLQGQLPEAAGCSGPAAPAQHAGSPGLLASRYNARLVTMNRPRTWTGREVRVARDGTDSVRDADEAVVLAWIKTHWEELATLAWRGYVTAGRGVLVLEGDWQGAVAVGYQTAAEGAAGGDPWPEELLAALQAYVPATDLLCVTQQGAATLVLTIRATPPQVAPCDAGQRDGARLVLAA
jgi:hypothetical protein